MADKDLAAVGLADCSAPITLPDDFSQDFPRGGGTYRVVERLDAIIFNVPEGASILWWDVEYGDCFGHQGTCHPSIILRDENSGSRLCLDSVTAEECGRYVVSADGASEQHDTARINEVFDRITNSARPEPRPTPAPVVMRYGAPQADGIVDAPGEYAFFSADGPITTYEGLRQDVERLVIHERDADGASWAAFYAEVAAGDDFEWRETDDCWVRYLVDEVLPDPTDAPLKALAVRWITYAYTGCSGTVATTGDRMWTWEPPNIRGPDVTVPVRHGPVLLIPSGWSGDTEEPVRLNPQAVGVEESSTGAGTPTTFNTTDLAEARTIPLWRDVTLPVSDWRFGSAQAGTYDSPPYGHGFQADYVTAEGGVAVSVLVGHMQVVPGHATAHYPGNTISIQEARIIDGYPALVLYNPDGKNPLAPTSVLIYDEENGVVYAAYGYIVALIGSNISPLIEIARSLYAEPAPVVMRYGAPQTDGVVDAPGEYAFFSANGPITTYEGLRQDVERLVIHERDAGGASWAAFYAGVEAGDDFEWREAADCWVRYLVDEVLPDPPDAPLKVLAVRWITYAYTGCSGAVSTTGDRMWTWVPPNIQSPDITVPVRHGIWLLLPPAYWNRLDWEGTDGVYEERIPLPGSSQAAQPEVSTDLAVVQRHPLWRTPKLPAGWQINWAISGSEGIDGYQAVYNNERGGIGIEIHVYRPQFYPQEVLVSGAQGSSIAEVQTIDDHQAIVKYSPSGSTAQTTAVWLFDATKGIAYVVVGIDGTIRGTPEAIIAIARSLYAEPAPVVMRYGAPQTDGVVDAPGEYAFFSADGPITTYEGLRRDVERLVIHERDADGASWAAFYAGVAAGDDFEWREADDCWVRYLVDEVLPDPTDAPLTALAVRWITYAYTGCSGALAATGDRMWTWTPENYQLSDPAIPIRHGPWQPRPLDWAGEVEEAVLVPVPTQEEIFGVDEIKRHPLWRDPAIPSGWRIHAISSGFNETYGVSVTYVNEEGYLALETHVYHSGVIGQDWPSTTVDPQIRKTETRIIDGHPAIVTYSPEKSLYQSTLVMIFNNETGVEYVVIGYDPSLKTTGIEATIKIARSLYLEEDQP